MNDAIRKFLTAAERLEIEKRVKTAESGTSGEIVVMAVGASSHYPSATMAGGATIALLLSITGMYQLRSENMWLFLMLFALMFIAAHELVKRIPLLKRPFAARREMVEEVEEASIKAFYLRKVHETTHRAGIFIYISLFERSVRVLADRGIDAKAGPQAWKEIVDLITNGINAGRQSEAIIEAVDRCAALLRLHFPGSGPGLNELGDVMIIGTPDH
jgi:putative membrane protein